MATTDCRPSNIYRIPVYQKRVTGLENYISIPYSRPPSPITTVLVSRRRHSTPPASTLRFVEVKSPSSNTVIKHYYPPVRTTRIIREPGSISDSIKSTPCSASLVQRRFQDERTVYTATAPTSLSSITDIILPVAKKNRNTIIDTPNHIVSDIQTVNHDSSTKKQLKKREQLMPLDLVCDVFLSEEDDREDSTMQDFV
ncbi:unnamed protein product [Rotaria sp. Silwood1]|nr:unnamed protein product [Rotaria sp. Silwood1]CAF1048437.1 unnamed protein product [Rotaria sp. Silwood1]CAF1069245.1 unnamed protein product [Rotaria sp. Silwood1]CAF3400522.1 unnamed protein product [Rotaria sp. Silwood1]CAF3420855.1 unnamed protein product [Rotaria sp. Silwood1]